MSQSNNPHRPQGAHAAPESASSGAEKTAQPPSVREAGKRLADEIRKAIMAEPGSAHALVDALEGMDAALAQPEFSRADLLPDAPWAVEGIGLMREGKPILPKHIHAIVNAAEAGLQAAGSFELRWAADMRAIDRWRRAEPSVDVLHLLEAAEAVIKADEEAVAELVRIGMPPSDEEISMRLSAGLRAAVSDVRNFSIEAATADRRELIMPDHADLVVWLLELLGAKHRGPTRAEIEEVVRSVDRRLGMQDRVRELLDRMDAVLLESERRCLQAEVRGVMAGRLLIEAAQLFRFYEASHRAKAERGNEHCDVPATLEKAERNAEIAGRIEALIPALDVPPQGAKLLPDRTCPSCGRDYAGGAETHCTAHDNCPSFFEERGLEHPDHA